MLNINRNKSSIYILCALSIFADLAVQASESLTMGVFPRRNSVVTVKMFAPLSRYLSQQLGEPIQLKTSKNFSMFWKNVNDKQYDIVHFNQLQYLLSHKSVGYKVFAKNEEFGQSSLQSSIIIRKDSGINTIADLKDKKIIFGGDDLAMVAFVGVKLMLLEYGLKDSDYKSIFARNPPNSSLAVFFNKADAGGVGDIALSVPNVTKRINAKELRYLAHGYRQSHLPWAFNPELPEDKQQKIQKIFLNLSSSEEGKTILRRAGLTNILSAKDADYNNSRNIYKRYKSLSE